MNFSKKEREAQLSKAKLDFRHSGDFDQYMEDATGIVAKFLDTKEFFLFASILYKDNNDKLRSSRYEYADFLAKNTFEPILEDAFTHLNNSAAYSLSNKLLEQSAHSEFTNILIASPITSEKDLCVFRLPKIDSDFTNKSFEEIARTISSEDSIRFETLLDIRDPVQSQQARITMSFYLKMQSVYCGEIYFYLIKPKSVHLEYNGVLAITLKRELSTDEYYDILLYFESIMSEVTIGVIQKQSRLLEVTKTIYGLGHLIKNRALPAQSKIESIEEYLEYLECGDYEAFIRSYIENAKINLQRLRNIGHLLDIISRSLNDQNNTALKGAVFVGKKSWYIENQPFDLSKEISSSTYRELSYEGNQVLFQNELNSQVLIYPAIETVEGQLLARPHDFIYEELLLEVSLNALTHGTIKDNYVHVKFGHNPSDPAWYYFENETTLGAFQKHGDKVVANKWFEIDLISTGGIYYYNNMLKISKSGLLNAMFVENGSKYYFRLGFQLLGLNY